MQARPTVYSAFMVTQDAVLAALRGVKDPQTQQDIVGLGLVRDLAIDGDSVALTLGFTTQPPPSRVTMHSMATKLVGQLPGVRNVQVRMGGGAAALSPLPESGRR